MIHAANLCRSEAVALEHFTSLFPDVDQIQHHVGTIRDGSYITISATLDVWNGSLKLLLQQAQDARINAEFPELMNRFFEEATASGFGDEHVMATYKVMRDASPG